MRKEILAGVEHVLSDVAGEWRVSIVGSRANDNWEMKVEGPLPGLSWLAKLGWPDTIRNVLIKLLPASRDDLPHWFALPSGRGRHRTI